MRSLVGRTLLLVVGVVLLLGAGVVGEDPVRPEDVAAWEAVDASARRI